MFKQRVVVLLLSVLLNAQAIKFKIFNKENETIWVLNEGLYGNDDLEDFALEPGNSKIIDTCVNWSGFIWARTHCDSSGDCLTGHCGDPNSSKCDNYVLNSTPYSYAVFRRNKGGRYWYGISFSRGFNVPISIEAFGNGRCQTSSCKQQLNEDCPSEYRFTNQNTTIGCHSPCTLSRNEKYCCGSGSYSAEEVCRSVELPEDFKDFFNSRCPDALVNTKEILKFKCKAQEFKITFGI